jgi:hypothetical protein
LDFLFSAWDLFLMIGGNTMKKIYITTALLTTICIASSVCAFQPTAIDPHVELITPGVTRSITITQYNTYPQDFSFFLVFLIGYGPARISMSTLTYEATEGHLLVLNGWALSSAGAVPIMKFGRSMVDLVVGVEIGDERYPSGIIWFSSWIAGPIEEELTYDIEIGF